MDQQDSMKTRDTGRTKIKLLDVENFLNYTPGMVLTVYTTGFATGSKMFNHCFKMLWLWQAMVITFSHMVLTGYKQL